MKNIIYALKDLFKNFFNWHGRLSKEGYGWAWAGILAINAGLLFTQKAALFLTLFSRYSCDRLISQITVSAITLWNTAALFPLLSATIRRYHDSGTPGWKAILFNALSLLFLIPGFFISSFTIIGFLFAGGYAVTASSSVNMAGLLKPGISGILFLSAGASFAILNIKTILRPSDTKKNPYGKPTSFHPPHKTKPQI